MDFAPVALDLFLDIEFLNPQIVTNPDRLPLVLIQQSSIQIKNIRQAVGNIQRHHHGFATHLSSLDSGGRRHRCFTNAAFAGKEYYPQFLAPHILQRGF